MKGNNVFYRVQQDPTWKLQTTFHRYADDLGTSIYDYLNSIVPDIHHHVSAHHNEIFNLSIPVGLVHLSIASTSWVPNFFA